MGSSCATKKSIIVKHEEISPKSRSISSLKHHKKISILSSEISIQSSFNSKYTFIKNLGKGGFGQVDLYKYSESPSLMFAVKTILKSGLDTFGVKNVNDEVLIHQNLDHPNIVKYFETYETDNEIMIVMEYIAGRCLSTLMKEREKAKTPFSENETAAIMKSIFKAIKYLNSKDVIHRDIKPANILFSSESFFII